MWNRNLPALAVWLGALLWCQPAMAVESSAMKSPLQAIPGVEGYQLLVKFRADRDPDMEPGGRLTLLRKQVPAGIQALISEYGIRFTRAIEYSEEELREMRRVVRHRFRDSECFNKYDFSGLMRVHAPDSSGAALREIGDRLQRLGEVEYASLEALHPAPPPVMDLPEPTVAADYPPATPDFFPRQTYWGPNPGIDIAYAWSLGLRGAGLAIADLEHSWGRLEHATRNVHEDFHNQDIAYGLPWKTDDYADHGQAVMGLLLAGENGFGINGAVNRARGHVYSVVHGDATALRAAIANSKRGDIVLLEMQRDGNAAPEVVKSLWDLIKQGSDAGVVMVETSGNGNQDLDAPGRAAYRGWGDAGAIVVGAGSPDRAHDKLSFSTFGKCCVHIQGWGSGVFTMGFGAGGLTYGTDGHQDYTATFNGTSSAGPIGTAAVALVQSFAKEKLDTLLTGKQIRDLLVSTGIPQGAGGHIGPLPNIRAAIQKLQGAVTAQRAADPSRRVRLHARDFNLGFSTPFPGARVRIALHDARGALVKVLVDEPKAAGDYALDLRDGIPVGAGVYYARLSVSGVEKSLRLVAL